MASNRFGQIFTITTWGESHGKAVGVVIDGCPAGLPLNEEEIRKELYFRRPGQNPFTSPRIEEDLAEIYSGVFEGYTTGMPISILIPNQSQDPSKYESIQHLLRPGHSNYTYLKKYGHYDYRGGGRASGRETVCRVAAGAVAKKLLARYGIQVTAFLYRLGTICCSEYRESSIFSLKDKILQSPVFCPDPIVEKEMIGMLEKTIAEGDSLGGMIEFQAEGVPIGLGDPVYEKLTANFAKGMVSIPGCKGIEFGVGFSAVEMNGSSHNDLFEKRGTGPIVTQTNHSGGILGGISSGMPLLLRVAFKPTSSIRKPQPTLNLVGEKEELQLPLGSKHDPCLALRAVPVVEAMGAIVLADALLMNLSSALEKSSEINTFSNI